MSEAALEKVQLERDGLAKELQLVQSAIPKDKVRAQATVAAASLSLFCWQYLRSCLHGINHSRFLLLHLLFSLRCAGR